MSRVARSARVGSRQRVETLGSGTSAPTAKTIGAAETGELYLIDHNHASALTITLPAMQDGAYFKFIVKTKLANNGSIVIQSSEGANGDFVGGVVEQVLNAGDGAVSYQLCGSHHKLTLSDDINIGSNIECVCDGSSWYVTGAVFTEAVGPNAVFGT
jgi:hypothetical protein